MLPIGWEEEEPAAVVLGSGEGEGGEVSIRLGSMSCEAASLRELAVDAPNPGRLSRVARLAGDMNCDRSKVGSRLVGVVAGIGLDGGSRCAFS